MQTLLTIGERSIATALAGRNTGAARRIITDLMQSDLVAPLLVATVSAQRSAHVQEGLLRLQLQKLRYQLAMHEQEAGREQREADACAVEGSPRALDALLPDSLLDNEGGPAAIKPLAVTSTGMQPIAPAVATAQLWQSLQMCMQPDAPLMRSLSEVSATESATQHASSGAALAAGVQQLAAWSEYSSTEAPPTWLPALQDVLLSPPLQTRLNAQVCVHTKGADGTAAEAGPVVDWRTLLQQDALHSAPVVTSLAAAAVSSGPQLRHSWLSFGDWLYVRVRRMRHARRAAAPVESGPPGAIGSASRGSKFALSASDEVCYRHVIIAYARVLALDYGSASGTDATRLLLRLLHFAIHHNTPAMAPAIAAAFAMVPPAAWEVLAPQLFVQLQHSKPHVRAYATQLLAGLAGPVPAAVLYTAVAAAAEQPEPSPEIAALLEAVSGGHEHRVAHCRMLLRGLRLLTPLAAESWQTALQAALVEVRRRVITLKAEAAREPGQAHAESAAQALWQRRYVAMVAHGVGRLTHLLQVRLGSAMVC
jgi:hypothetical protein